MASDGYYYWDEALPEIIPGFRWDLLSEDDWGEISDALDEHVSMAQEFMPPVPSRDDLEEIRDNPEITALKEKVKSLERQLEIYNDDVVRVHGGRYTYADTYTGRVVIEDR